MPPETNDASETTREVRIGRVLDEVFGRRARGEAASDADVLRRHPELADDLRPHLALLRHLGAARQTPAEMEAATLLTPDETGRLRGTLGPYEIQGVIGRGGMGMVLRSYDARLRRPVALKVLRPEMADDPAALARFEREARAAAALHHANIVAVHDVGQDRGLRFIVMEHVEGHSLATWIRTHGPLPARLAREAFRQLLAALAAAHGAGLVHRDVKSSNVLLQDAGSPPPAGVGAAGPPAPASSANSPQPGGPAQPLAPSPGSMPTVKLADFGLARMRGSQTQVTIDGSVLGTPEYMSPEQARGDSDIDHRTDLYSAGVVLYEMLTGVTPFKAETPTATIRRILDEEPRDPRKLGRDVDLALASLALRLMAKRREDRYASAAEALQAMQAGSRIGLPRLHTRHIKRAAWAAAAVGLLACVTWWFWPARAGSVRVRDVKIDDHFANVLNAWYGDDPNPLVFRQFPADVELGAAVALMLRGEAGQFVVVGTRTPLDGQGAMLAAYRVGDRSGGAAVWSLPLQTTAPWPDCPVPHACFAVIQLLCLEHGPGQDPSVIVLANDPRDYPARVSLLDPRNGRITATFWHYGQLLALRVLPDYFGADRPAILGWGVNNKLDGFDDPNHAARAWTTYDKVPVVLILNPNTMDGHGPPYPAGMPFPPAIPDAYAFLNLSSESADYPTRVVTSAGNQDLREPPGLTAVRIEPTPASADETPWFCLALPGVKLIVDRNLALRGVEPTDGGPPVPTDFWTSRWTRLYQGGQLVGGS